MSIRNIRLNLLPPEFRPAPTVSGFNVFFIVIIGVTVLFLLLTVATTQRRNNKLKSQIDNTRQEIVHMQKSARQYDRISAGMLVLKKKKEMFAYLDNRFIDWAGFIANLVPLVPKDLWIVEIEAEIDKDGMNRGDVAIVGRTSSAKLLPVVFLMQNLDASPYFGEVSFTESALGFIASKPVQEFTISVGVEGFKSYVPKKKPASESDAEKDDEKVAAANTGAT